MSSVRPKNLPDASRVDPDGELVHDELGRELPDPTPMEPPIGYKRQPSLSEMMAEQRRIRAWELSGQFDPDINETMEEANDLDPEDGFDAVHDSTPYPVVEDDPPPLRSTDHRQSSKSVPKPPEPSRGEPPQAAGTPPADDKKKPE